MEQLKYELQPSMETYKSTIEKFSLSALRKELSSLNFHAESFPPRAQRIELQAKIDLVLERIKLLEPQERVQSKVWNIIHALFGREREKIWQY